MKIKSLILIILLMAAAPAFGEDDFQYWPRLLIKAIDTKYVDYTSYGEIRFMRDAGRPGLWQTSQKIQYDFLKNLSFVTTYTYLENKVTDTKRKTDEFQYHHRMEFEFNPHWQPAGRFKLFNRNRMEFRWIEDKGSDNGRYRQLWEVELPTKVKQIPFLKSIYVNNEIFVDFNRRTLAENRATPIGITFRLSEKNSIKVFYLIQSKKGASDWSSNQILGTQLVLAF